MHCLQNKRGSSNMGPNEKQKIEIEKLHWAPLPPLDQAVTADYSDFLGQHRLNITFLTANRFTVSGLADRRWAVTCWIQGTSSASPAPQGSAQRSPHSGSHRAPLIPSYAARGEHSGGRDHSSWRGGPVLVAVGWDPSGDPSQR